VEGLACDVLFDGLSAQNRAVRVCARLSRFPRATRSRGTFTFTFSLAQVDGDTVAYRLLPASGWPLVGREEEEGADEGTADTASAEGDETEEAPSPLASVVGTSLTLAPSDEVSAVASLRRSCCGPPTRRPLACVVALTRPSPRRQALVGYLEAPTPSAAPHQAASPGRGAQALFWKFRPADPRLPWLNIDPASLPAFATAARDTRPLSSSLFTATLTHWALGCSTPLGRISSLLGASGAIEPETAALVAEYALPDEPFTQIVLDCLPCVPAAPQLWAVPPEELQARKDNRKHCVFSIDPPTARDLDDALSVVRLPGGTYKVGVHIADVSHFIAAGSALDEEASRRATSSYLVQRVIPMLPRLLCDDLCSLNPGVDRLTFSVEWEMDSSGNILDEWMGRGVIRSAAKMDYATAQSCIDSARSGASPAEPLRCHPTLSIQKPHSADVVAQAVLSLHALAQKLRSERFAAGALRLDNPKLSFRLDEQGDPIQVVQYITGESHQLVEEFMLLANRRVAAKIASAFPQAALLRRHPPPDPRKLAELATFSGAHSLALDTSSSKALHASLTALRCSRPDAAPLATLLATKPMQLAMYFSTGDVPPEQWGHYALAMDRYTHFTSPIRRYADVLVHRALAAALDGDTRSGRVLCGEELRAVAQRCNERKAAAKAAQDGSAQVFLCAMLRRQARVTEAHVLAVGPKFLHCFLNDYGFEVRVSLEGAALPKGVAVRVAKDGMAVTLSQGDAHDQAAGGAAPLRATLTPATLPLRLAPFSRIPVRLSASSADGKRSEVLATLLLAA